MTIDHANQHIKGYFEILDVTNPCDKRVLVSQPNAVHYENFSEALALSVANKTTGFIHELHLGNGGTSVDTTGVIAYLSANNTGSSADLYNATYYKVVDDTSESNTDPTNNKIVVSHVDGTIYSDLYITCLLDYGEPAGQEAFDNSANLDGQYVFDELGLKGWATEGLGQGKLLTHAVFHPIQKSLSRLIEIQYTIRIQTLSSLSSAT